MNTKTARLITAYAAAMEMKIKVVKQIWLSTPRPDRKKLRKEMKRVVDQAKKEKAKREAQA